VFLPLVPGEMIAPHRPEVAHITRMLSDKVWLDVLFPLLNFLWVVQLHVCVEAPVGGCHMLTYSAPKLFSGEVQGVHCRREVGPGNVGSHVNT